MSKELKTPTTLDRYQAEEHLRNAAWRLAKANLNVANKLADLTGEDRYDAIDTEMAEILSELIEDLNKRSAQREWLLSARGVK